MIKKVYRWSFVLCWMFFIYAMSATPVTKSWELSGSVADKIVVAEQDSDQQNDDNKRNQDLKNLKDTLNVMVRKCAHVIEYFVLCALLIFAWGGSGQEIGKVMKKSFFVSFLYATLDELHQLLVPGRTGNIKDVMIDTIGILLAIVVIYIYINLKRKYCLRSSRGNCNE